MRIAFLGTPEFALPSLQMLIDAGHTLCVFTQPDKPQGRHAVLTPPPVKVLAQQYGIPVYQPRRMRDTEGLEPLRAFKPDLMVTAAFGQILSAENLEIPQYGCINVHGSLLPKYRGAAPIQWAVIDGEEVTGITTMLTDVGLDTGDILIARELKILPDETSGELYIRMAELGADVLKETIEVLLNGTLSRTPQEEEKATKCRMLKKEDGKLIFTRPAKSVHDRVRGVNPWPGAYAYIEAGMDTLKIWRTRMTEGSPAGEPGVLFGDEKRGMFVCCADGMLEILELQAAGGKRMEAKAYLRGKPLAGQKLV